MDADSNNRAAILTEMKKASILLVEDDEIDREAIQRSFGKRQLKNKMVTAHDGCQALEILRSESENLLPHPFIILLDLNMPKMNGLEFLAELRADPKLKNSVVFVLTTSNDDRDRVAAYNHHVAGYVLKSKAGEDFLNLINLLEYYWKCIELPPEDLSH